MLINSEVGAEDELVEKLRELENVEEAYGVYGAYDIIVKVRASTEKEFGDSDLEDKEVRQGSLNTYCCG
jgi:DNA-binding Lrp family transcriptional regulator